MMLPECDFHSPVHDDTDIEGEPCQAGPGSNSIGKFTDAYRLMNDNLNEGPPINLKESSDSKLAPMNMNIDTETKNNLGPDNFILNSDYFSGLDNLREKNLMITESQSANTMMSMNVTDQNNNSNETQRTTTIQTQNPKLFGINSKNSQEYSDRCTLGSKSTNVGPLNESQSGYSASASGNLSVLGFNMNSNLNQNSKQEKSNSNSIDYLNDMSQSKVTANSESNNYMKQVQNQDYRSNKNTSTVFGSVNSTNQNPLRGAQRVILNNDQQYAENSESSPQISHSEISKKDENHLNESTGVLEYTDQHDTTINFFKDAEHDLKAGTQLLAESGAEVQEQSCNSKSGSGSASSSNLRNTANISNQTSGYKPPQISSGGFLSRKPSLEGRKPSPYKRDRSISQGSASKKREGSESIGQKQLCSASKSKTVKSQSGVTTFTAASLISDVEPSGKEGSQKRPFKFSSSRDASPFPPRRADLVQKSTENKDKSADSEIRKILVMQESGHTNRSDSQSPPIIDDNEKETSQSLIRDSTDMNNKSINRSFSRPRVPSLNLNSNASMRELRQQLNEPAANNISDQKPHRSSSVDSRPRISVTGKSQLANTANSGSAAAQNQNLRLSSGAQSNTSAQSGTQGNKRPIFDVNRLKGRTRSSSQSAALRRLSGNGTRLSAQSAQSQQSRSAQDDVVTARQTIGNCSTNAKGPGRNSAVTAAANNGYKSLRQSQANRKSDSAMSHMDNSDCYSNSAQYASVGNGNLNAGRGSVGTLNDKFADAEEISDAEKTAREFEKNTNVNQGEQQCNTARENLLQEQVSNQQCSSSDFDKDIDGILGLPNPPSDAKSNFTSINNSSNKKSDLVSSQSYNDPEAGDPLDTRHRDGDPLGFQALDENVIDMFEHKQERKALKANEKAMKKSQSKSNTYNSLDDHVHALNQDESRFKEFSSSSMATVSQAVTVQSNTHINQSDLASAHPQNHSAANDTNSDDIQKQTHCHQTQDQSSQSHSSPSFVAMEIDGEGLQSLNDHPDYQGSGIFGGLNQATVPMINDEKYQDKIENLIHSDNLKLPSKLNINERNPSSSPVESLRLQLRKTSENGNSSNHSRIPSHGTIVNEEIQGGPESKFSNTKKSSSVLPSPVQKEPTPGPSPIPSQSQDNDHGAGFGFEFFPSSFPVKKDGHGQSNSNYQTFKDAVSDGLGLDGLESVAPLDVVQARNALDKYSSNNISSKFQDHGQDLGIEQAVSPMEHDHDIDHNESSYENQYDQNLDLNVHRDANINNHHDVDMELDIQNELIQNNGANNDNINQSQSQSNVNNRVGTVIISSAAARVRPPAPKSTVSKNQNVSATTSGQQQGVTGVKASRNENYNHGFGGGSSRVPRPLSARQQISKKHNSAETEPVALTSHSSRQSLGRNSSFDNSRSSIGAGHNSSGNKQTAIKQNAESFKVTTEATAGSEPPNQRNQTRQKPTHIYGNQNGPTTNVIVAKSNNTTTAASSRLFAGTASSLNRQASNRSVTANQTVSVVDQSKTKSDKTETNNDSNKRVDVAVDGENANTNNSPMNTARSNSATACPQGLRIVYNLNTECTKFKARAPPPSTFFTRQGPEWIRAKAEQKTHSLVEPKAPILATEKRHEMYKRRMHDQTQDLQHKVQEKQAQTNFKAREIKQAGSQCVMPCQPREWQPTKVQPFKLSESTQRQRTPRAWQADQTQDAQSQEKWRPLPVPDTTYYPTNDIRRSKEINNSKKPVLTAPREPKLATAARARKSSAERLYRDSVEEQNRTEQKKFTAAPCPDFSQCKWEPVIEKSEPVRPVEFKLSTEKRGQHHREEFEKTKERILREKQQDEASLFRPFKANPVRYDDNEMKDIGTKPVARLPLTTFNEFHLADGVRKRSVSPAAAGDGGCGAIHKPKPLPQTTYIKAIPKKPPTRDVTQICEFNLTNNEETHPIKHRRMEERLLEEKKKNEIPKWKPLPVPDFISNESFFKGPPIIKSDHELVKPEPFQLSSSNMKRRPSAEEFQRDFHAQPPQYNDPAIKLMGINLDPNRESLKTTIPKPFPGIESRERERTPCRKTPVPKPCTNFKAQPVPASVRDVGVSIAKLESKKPPPKPQTKQVPFQLATEKQHEHRLIYEKEKAARMEAKEREEDMKKLQRQEEEKREIAEERKRREFKAKKMPEYYANLPQVRKPELTTPTLISSRLVQLPQRYIAQENPNLHFSNYSSGFGGGPGVVGNNSNNSDYQNRSLSRQRSRSTGAATGGSGKPRQRSSSNDRKLEPNNLTSIISKSTNNTNNNSSNFKFNSEAISNPDESINNGNQAQTVTTTNFKSQENNDNNNNTSLLNTTAGISNAGLKKSVNTGFGVSVGQSFNSFSKSTNSSFSRDNTNQNPNYNFSSGKKTFAFGPGKRTSTGSNNSEGRSDSGNFNNYNENVLQNSIQTRDGSTMHSVTAAAPNVSESDKQEQVTGSKNLILTNMNQTRPGSKGLSTYNNVLLGSTGPSTSSEIQSTGSQQNNNLNVGGPVDINHRGNSKLHESLSSGSPPPAVLAQEKSNQQQQELAQKKAQTNNINSSLSFSDGRSVFGDLSKSVFGGNKPSIFASSSTLTQQTGIGAQEIFTDSEVIKTNDPVNNVVTANTSISNLNNFNAGTIVSLTNLNQQEQNLNATTSSNLTNNSFGGGAKRKNVGNNSSERQPHSARSSILHGNTNTKFVQRPSSARGSNVSSQQSGTSIKNMPGKGNSNTAYQQPSQAQSYTSRKSAPGIQTASNTTGGPGSARTGASLRNNRTSDPMQNLRKSTIPNRESPTTSLNSEKQKQNQNSSSQKFGFNESQQFGNSSNLHQGHGNTNTVNQNFNHQNQIQIQQQMAPMDSQPQVQQETVMTLSKRFSIASADSQGSGAGTAGTVANTRKLFEKPNFIGNNSNANGNLNTNSDSTSNFSKNQIQNLNHNIEAPVRNDNNMRDTSTPKFGGVVNNNNGSNLSVPKQRSSPDMGPSSPFEDEDFCA